ncbi:MAG: bifunctional riboflavin kinase/FAD synthetase [Clostridia bacterium]|nr:bifunctional riboflavin kinase/FAD synthetase [Clostridia bacterium]
MSYVGFINLNKETGISSQHAVAAIKRLLHVKSGHCGTLDPLAEGVLPICLGRATRLSGLVMGREKTYIGVICFGAATISYDAGSEVTAEADAAGLTKQALLDVLPRFTGAIDQVPPAVSALKKDGVPLYKRVRRGERVELKPRPVMIYSLRLLDFTPGARAYATIEVECGQGAYIRSLAYHLGQALGLPAHLAGLQRTKNGDFLLENAVTIAQIQAMAEAGDFSFIRPMSEALSFMPVVNVGMADKTAISHGREICCPPQFAAGSRLRVEDGAGNLLAIGEVICRDGEWKIKTAKVLIDPQPPLACAIGNFDGLHLGHQALFRQLYRIKQARSTLSAVLTFAPHPLSLIRGMPPRLITGESLKGELLQENFAVERVITLPFDRALMNSTPEQFIEQVIIRQLQASHIVVGYNFTFAAGGAGDAALLRELCAKYDIEVLVVDEVDGAYGLVSSTNIREHLAEGDLAAVNEMLGYWFVMGGEVIVGNRIGRTIGFPTANFLPAADQAAPPTGVYASRIEHQGKTYDGIANFGFRPTVGGEALPLVEAHIFDQEIELYGENIRVWFGQFIRPEKRFADLIELQRQIEQDSRLARKFLRPLPANKHLPKRIG